MRVALILGGLIVGGVLVSLSVSAQGPSETAEHPLVGTWIVSSSSEPAVPKDYLFTFFADGNAMATDSLGRTWQGVWEATGPRTASLKVVVLGREGTTDVGSSYWAHFNVDESGDNLAGSEFNGVRLKNELRDATREGT